MFGTAVALVLLWLFYAVGGVPGLLGVLLSIPLRVMDLFDKIFPKKEA